MAFKVAVASIMAVAMIDIASAQNIQKKYSSVEYFKNYALSTCIADGYTSDEVVKDGAAAARGYLEFGSLPLEAHTEATLLGRKFLKREYKSVSGESLTLMKCIDFYHSKELDQLARKYRGKR
jgi:hypothetical protein